MPVPLRIDFAARGRPSGRSGVVWLVAGVVAIAATLYTHGRLQAEVERLEARSEALAQQLDPHANAKAPRDPAQRRALRQRIEASNRVLHALDQPWIRLFDELESATVDGVTLLAMEPDANKTALRMVGEAPDRDALSRYLERLGRLDSLREVRLSQHELREASEGTALRFILSARWMPST
jgi:hypothetical protein